MNKNKNLKKIIIVGGGAGGLELVTKLGNNLGKKKLAKIILVDNNYIHLWKPWLHKFASGSLNEGTNYISYISHARSNYFEFCIGKMIGIDRNRKIIILDDIFDENGKQVLCKREINYDILVISVGSKSNYFNIPGVKENCNFIDNIYQAKKFHKKMFNLFLKISIKPDENKKSNISIVGGGATGVELSAELINSIEELYKYGFQGLNKNLIEITLIEMGERILSSLPKRISNIVDSELKKIGIKIITNTAIIKCDANGLFTNNGSYIESDIMVWAAGIKSQKFNSSIDLETNNINQFIVKKTLQTTLDEKIFAIGDCSCFLLKTGEYVPPRAQAAHQMARCVYLNILFLIKNKKLNDYVYKDYGSLISLSKFKTVGSFMGNMTKNSIFIEGIIAKLAYVMLYRMHQISVNGCLKTSLMILSTGIENIISPKLKLH
ncbi:ndh [Wigglesworthia glossinidia endosymbiont of Glossina brevipalpis]|uniref:Ndh protein n=1 Tax=Wigglesworthia glossinidia brevipalpis TaxID=36870 RepID=Q8D3A3_WIGBR|nr:ndh [Wigglesworthia glossinidia endosymbiont of Glossina brevipalpis]